MSDRSIVFVLMCALAVTAALPLHAQAPSELRWGGDAEGGAPFVEADPDDPARVVGFEVDIAALLARGLGRTPRFIQIGFTTLDASAARGDFDIGLSGIEDSAARRTRLAVTIPVLPVPRDAHRARGGCAAVSHARRPARPPRRDAGATLAYDLLTAAQTAHGVVPVTYEDDVHPVQRSGDRARGRGAARRSARRAGVRRNPGLINQATDMGVGYYVGILAPGNAALARSDRRDPASRRCATGGSKRSSGGGTCGTTISRGSTRGCLAASRWTCPQTQSLAPGSVDVGRHAALPAGAAERGGDHAGAVGAVDGAGGRRRRADRERTRVRPGSAEVALTAWVEIIRGTPLLLQLFVLYFGLAAVVQLPAFLAALIGLGLNYAAYESEIYRGALEAVPAGQLDAARTLGFSERQTLLLVRGPQAFRLALAPMTNDFVALLKDSSLVSVITVVELTKQTSIFAVEHRQLGGARLAVRRDVPGDVAAARAAGAAARDGRGAGRERPRRPRPRSRSAAPRPIVRGVSFDAARGEIVGVMGASGAGKTTVLRAIAGLDPITGGSIAIEGLQLVPGPVPRGERRRELHRRVGMVFQFHHLFAHLTALHNVWLAPVHVQRRPQAEAERTGARAARAAGRRRTAPTRCRTSCRAARRSAWRLRGRWPSIRRCC